MSNKLQELTDKLYNEGLSKGREEGEMLLAKARTEADEIRNSAKREADAIIAEAEKSAAAIREKAESDIKMASAQSLQATKKDIEDLLVNAMVSDKASKALADKDFIKEIIRTIAEKFSSEASDISLVLPVSMKGELEKWVSSELGAILGKEVKAEFSKKIQGGFTIGPKDGSWFVNFSDDTFRQLIAEYLRPVTRKILFG